MVKEVNNKCELNGRCFCGSQGNPSYTCLFLVNCLDWVLFANTSKTGIATIDSYCFGSCRPQNAEMVLLTIHRANFAHRLVPHKIKNLQRSTMCALLRYVTEKFPAALSPLVPNSPTRHALGTLFSCSIISLPWHI